MILSTVVYMILENNKTVNKILIARESSLNERLIKLENTNDIAFTIDKSDLDKTLKTLDNMKEAIGASRFQVDDKIAKVSIVGAGMIDRPGIAASMFNTLAGQDINIKMISTSEIKISCLVDEADADKAVIALHKSFNLDCDEIAEVKGTLPDV